MKKLLAVTFVATIFTGMCFAQIPYNQRYTYPIFDEVNVTAGVIYGNAPVLNFPYLDENNTSPEDLLMDIYEPGGDMLEQRPAVICVHSGAFVSGSRSADDMVAFCDSLARRGYVTASIDYRLGMNAFSSSSSTRAVYRGIQDGRAAIRFLKENAAIYKIDTNNIYMLGSSAGAYIGQHNYYMDTEDDRPAESYTSPDLGCLDCAGNDFQHSGKASGVVALWGALMDTTLIISSDTLPIFLAHGTADATVPFGYGSAFGNDNFPATYGSSLVAEQLTSFGNAAQTYFVLGAGHEFYGTSNGNWSGTPNAYWDSVYTKVQSFYYDVQKPMAGFTLTQIENVAIFTDTSRYATGWYWDFGDGTYSTEQNPMHEYLQSGEYTAVQFAINQLESWDTTSAIASSFVGIEENNDVKFTMFPNPASNNVTISNNTNSNFSVTVTNTMGMFVTRFSILALQNIKLDLTYYPKGSYIITAKNGKQKLIKKLIIL